MGCRDREGIHSIIGGGESDLLTPNPVLSSQLKDWACGYVFMQTGVGRYAPS